MFASPCSTLTAQPFIRIAAQRVYRRAVVALKLVKFQTAWDFPLPMEHLQAFFGLFVCVGLAFLVSKDRKHFPLRLVLIGILLQAILAFSVLGIPALGISGPLRFIFDGANDAIIAFLNFTDEGSRFVFGQLVSQEKSGFLFAFQVMPTIIFMSAIMAVLYQVGVMQYVVGFFAVIMQKAMGTSGAESLSSAGNIFLGQTEAPLLIKPYVAQMTLSELFAVMVGGMANVAGGVLAAYVGLLKNYIPDIAGHLLAASCISAPASLVIAKIIIPEREVPETLGTMPKEEPQVYTNLVEAAAGGASEGLYLALNVVGMLIAFIALVAMVNAGLAHLGDWIQFSSWGRSLVPEALVAHGEPVRLSLQMILSWFFAPIAWIMGIPWNETLISGSMLGEKIVLNEFVAYLSLAKLGPVLTTRTAVILSYALCGFANFSSIAIQIGGIGSMAPTRRGDLARLGMRAVIGGSLSSFMTACFAGMLT